MIERDSKDPNADTFDHVGERPGSTPAPAAAARFWYWLEARDERRATAAAVELLGPVEGPAVRRIVCPSCGVPFFRHGAARSSCFYRTREENDTCIVCREGLDPVTLEPLAGVKGTP